MTILSLSNNSPIPDILPTSWDFLQQCDITVFRNLSHFKNCVGQVKQRDTHKGGVDYVTALSDLVSNKPQITESKALSIRELVRSNLFKRGLITEEVYEEYRYTDSGTVVGFDMGRYAEGDPECIITPTHQYVDFFHEVYINASYSYILTDEQVTETTAKILSAIEELERRHIFIKVTLVLPISSVSIDRDNYFALIPLFSHKEQKTIDTMSSVLNSRLLRKFFFAILEDQYGSRLSGNYGQVKSLPKTINMGDQFDEIRFFEGVLTEVGEL